MVGIRVQTISRVLFSDIPGVKSTFPLFRYLKIKYKVPKTTMIKKMIETTRINWKSASTSGAIVELAGGKNKVPEVSINFRNQGLKQ